MYHGSGKVVSAVITAIVPGRPEKVKVLSTDLEMRINGQITVIVRRHSAAVVEVYRHGVLVWKAGESSGASTGTGMRHSGESTGLGICNGVITEPKR